MTLDRAMTGIGGLLLVVGVVAGALGLVEWSGLAAIGERTWPIVAFVVAVTVVAELAEKAGVFDRIADAAAAVARGRALVLWLGCAVLATACTVFLSLDTTAVLLTPVVLTVARRSGASPVPFALLTVWSANTASLLLPVSNLTNLLAADRLGLDPAGFAAIAWPAAVVAIVVPIALLTLLHRRDLTGRLPVAAPQARRSAHPALLVTASVVLVALVPALVSGVDVWIPAAIAALVLLVAFAATPGHRGDLRPSLVPWSLVVFVFGLFAAVEVLHEAGLERLLVHVAPDGSGPGALAALAAAGAAGANAVNNLPAYVALEPLATDAHRAMALLVGVNVGPLVTPWASLATLLWHQRVQAQGVEIGWGRYAVLGLGCAVLTGGLAVATLALSA